MKAKPEWLIIFVLLAVVCLLLGTMLLGSSHPEAPPIEIANDVKGVNIRIESLEERKTKLEADLTIVNQELVACKQNVLLNAYARRNGSVPDTTTVELTDVGMAALARQSVPVDYVIGITASISRPSVGAMHLIQTIQAIFASFPHQRMRIVVLSTDADYIRGSIITTHLKQTFPVECETGLIKVLRMNHQVYPPTLLYNPCFLSNNFNDSLQRVKWASKLAIDVSFIMEHASPLGKYYLHIEDDTPPIPTAWGDIDRFVRTLELEAKKIDKSGSVSYIEQTSMWAHDPVLHDQGFFLLRLCNEKLLRMRMGAAFGLVYRSSDLPALVRWLRERYDYMPVDWNIGFFLHYSKWRSRVFTSRKCLFSHMGHESTKMGVDDPTAHVILHGEFTTWEQCEEAYPGFVMKYNATLNAEGKIVIPVKP